MFLFSPEVLTLRVFGVVPQLCRKCKEICGVVGVVKFCFCGKLRCLGFGVNKQPQHDMGSHGEVDICPQVTEKKLKQVSNLNIEPSARANGKPLTDGAVLNPKGFPLRSSMNGGPLSRPGPVMNPDFEFPPGGIPSLHLPMVLVLLTFCYGYGSGLFFESWMRCCAHVHDDNMEKCMK